MENMAESAELPCPIDSARAGSMMKMLAMQA